MFFDFDLDLDFDMLPLDLEMLLLITSGEREKFIEFRLIDNFGFLIFFECTNSLLLSILWDLDFDLDLLV